MKRKGKIAAWVVIAALLLAAGVLGVTRDAPDRQRNALWAALSRAEPGDTVVFGRWEQDGSLDNGPEPIAWLVLEKREGRLLAVSRDILDCRPFHETWADKSWRDSSLRAWLNGPFREEAFGEGERALTVLSRVETAPNPLYGTPGGENAEDYVFLLSLAEAEAYFPGDGARRAAATPWAQEQGAWADEEGASLWWLRSPGENGNHAAIVNYAGALHPAGHLVNLDRHGVRPALWLGVGSPENAHNAQKHND